MLSVRMVCLIAACGEPYGPNGELPEHTRRKRQIIFPDEPQYSHFFQLLLDTPFTRVGEVMNLLPSPDLFDRTHLKGQVFNIVEVVPH